MPLTRSMAAKSSLPTPISQQAVTSVSARARPESGTDRAAEAKSTEFGARDVAKRHADFVAHAERIARDAGAILRTRFDGDIAVRYKGLVDPVTDADEKVEHFIKEEIWRRYPEHAIWAEETGKSRADAHDVRWIVDPIDGTTNFLRRNPVFSVLIGVQERNLDGNFVTVAGVVHDPMRNELFKATLGGGAYLGDRRLRTSQTDRMEQMLCATDYAYDRLFQQQSNHAETTRMSLLTASIRTSGSAGLDLAWVAAGRLDLSWHHALKPWDMAPGALLITEAGGQVTNLFGAAFSVEEKSIAASNGRVHATCIAELSKARSLPFASREGMDQFLDAKNASKLASFREQTGL